MQYDVLHLWRARLLWLRLLQYGKRVLHLHLAREYKVVALCAKVARVVVNVLVELQPLLQVGLQLSVPA